MADEKTERTKEPQGFGAQLRAAREAEGISLGDMAVRSRLSVAQLRALEEEDVDALPEPVYVRAFIRGCAHSLGLDGTKLVEDYVTRYMHGNAAQLKSQVPAADPDTELVINAAPRHRGLKAALCAVLVLAVAAGIWAVYTDQFGMQGEATEAQKIEAGAAEGAATPAEDAEQKKLGQAPADAKAQAQADGKAAGSEPARSSPAAHAGAAASTAAAPAAQAAPQAPTAQNAPSASNASSAKAAQPAASSSAAPNAAASSAAEAPQQAQPAQQTASAADAAEPQQPAASLTHRVEFRIKAPCWVQVMTPQGRNVVAREMRPGDDVGVDVPKGSRFTIGNADAAELVIDGEPYSLEGTVRNGISRFTIE